MTHRSGFQLGPWLLTSKIATGGMGEVFIGLRAGVGEHQSPVAVKALLKHLSGDEEAVERFVSEAQLASRMNHPNLVRILDVGVHEGRHWLAMDLVQGVSASTLLAAAKKAATPLPAEVLTWVGVALCDGLEHAHALKGSNGAPLDLVHRDVTPHNLLLSADGEVKLTDFGIARVRDGHERTRPGQVHGKLEYLSPEQLEGRPADRRSDVYAAGVTLFTLATGAEPFARATPQATTRAIRTEDPESLAGLRPDLPPTFVAAVRRAMARKPEERFQTAGALRDALGPAPGGAKAKLSALVRSLCATEVQTLGEAVAMAEALAPQTRGMAPPPPSAPPRPRPRGTMEVEAPRSPKGLPWKWLLGALAALVLAGALLLAR
jgi:eukaryotic-like serine/threonine-protein kinase